MPACHEEDDWPSILVSVLVIGVVCEQKIDSFFHGFALRGAELHGGPFLLPAGRRVGQHVRT